MSSNNGDLQGRRTENGGHHCSDHQVNTLKLLTVISSIVLNQVSKDTNLDCQWFRPELVPGLLASKLKVFFFTAFGFWFHISGLSLPSPPQKELIQSVFAFAFSSASFVLVCGVRRGTTKALIDSLPLVYLKHPFLLVLAGENPHLWFCPSKYNLVLRKIRVDRNEISQWAQAAWLWDSGYNGVLPMRLVLSGGALSRWRALSGLHLQSRKWRTLDESEAEIALLGSTDKFPSPWWMLSVLL